MRTLTLALAAAGTMLTTPALARDGQPYLGIEAGAVFPESFDYDLEGTPALVTPGDDDGRPFVFAEGDNGWEGDILVGYDFGLARLELEGGYKRFDVETLTALAPGIPGPVGSTGIGTFTPADGKIEVISGMVNALVDLGGNEGIGFYFGGGAGIAEVQASLAAGNSTGTFVDDDDRAFAFQGIAGLRLPVSDRVDLGLKYRYFEAGELDYTDTAGRSVSSVLSTHSVLASLFVNFGGSAPPPPPVAQCNQGPYIVFFDWDQSTITPEAATILDSAIAAYGNCGTVPIMLAGYTDRSGTVQYNLGLAARRNESVRSYLTGKGIPAARITSEAFGEANPRVPTADGVRELQNRRVEITYGPGSGM